jgi:hypothetical protein
MSADFSVSISRAFPSGGSTIVYDLCVFGGESNNAIRLAYDTARHQMLLMNEGKVPDLVSISYTFHGNTKGLGDIPYRAVPADGTTKYLDVGEKFYLTPTGQYNSIYSPIRNNEKIIFEDLTVTIGNIAYGFDMNNQNINTKWNRILIAGLATELPDAY